MDFTFTAEQDQLRDSVRGFLGRENDFPVRTSASRGGVGWRPELWHALAEQLGILGIAIPSEHGGVGGDRTDLLVVLEETGANLMVEPFIETAVIAAEALVRADRGDDLARLVAGDDIWAFAWAEDATRYGAIPQDTIACRNNGGWRLTGAKSIVVAAPWANRLLVTAAAEGGVALFAVPADAPGVMMTSYPTIDGRRAADIAFADVELPIECLVAAPDAGAAEVRRLIDIGTAALGAEALGVLRRLFDDTVGYTRERRQFGRPISEFQVLQHRMVDMYLELELATSAVYRGMLMLDAPEPERALAVAAMKVTVGQACRFVGQNAVQLHGGMGMTDELAVSHAFKRATVIEQEFGDVDHHLARLAAMTN